MKKDEGKARVERQESVEEENTQDGIPWNICGTASTLGSLVQTAGCEAAVGKEPGS